jgi:hypothetical protein
MTAIEEVRARLEATGLKGKVMKTHYKMRMGYWFWPDQGEAVYLGASKAVALVAIDAEKYSAKRQLERDHALAVAYKERDHGKA